MSLSDAEIQRLRSLIGRVELLERFINSAGEAALSSVKIGSSTLVDAILDEDDMFSDSAKSLATQQSIKAYTDAEIATTVSAISTRDREFTIVLVDEDTALAVEDGVGNFKFPVPSEINGYNLIGIAAGVYTVSSSGAITIQVHNFTDSQDMLSTAMTIDANEKSTATAATPAVINASYDDVATGDELRFDLDGVGTGSKGLWVKLVFGVV